MRMANTCCLSSQHPGHVGPGHQPGEEQAEQQHPPGLAVAPIVLDERPPEPAPGPEAVQRREREHEDRKSTRLNSSHVSISYAVFCLKKKNKSTRPLSPTTIHNQHYSTTRTT